MKKKQSILAVDDEPDIIFVVKMRLSDYYEVDAYTDPVRVLASVTPRRYELLLFDYLMPKMNRFEFYQAIEQIDPGIHMCMVTAYEAIPTDDRGTDPVQPFDSNLCSRSRLTKMLTKLKEILSDKR